MSISHIEHGIVNKDDCVSCHAVICMVCKQYVCFYSIAFASCVYVIYACYSEQKGLLE